ncbi:MAG: hydroxymethylbilane synthase, partial [Verrucomicrobiota bacterium]|nr:hydroxymethylbilane synthase [Verrucomicrobiota bacterium]
MTKDCEKVVLATRKSPLALRQAELASSALQRAIGAEVEILPLSTTGDQRLEWSLEQEGGKGLFTKELEVALLDGRADLAVHSAKDMPTDLPQGLALAGYLPREDPRDVLVIRDEVEVPRVIATGSPRRRAQILQGSWSDAEVREIRGNVGTRLRKIAEGREADATILAAAGLRRLGIDGFAGLRFEYLALEAMVPAPGQAAIALQSREDEIDRFTRACDPVTAEEVNFERSVLATMGGGCQVAVGIHRKGDRVYMFDGVGEGLFK